MTGYLLALAGIFVLLGILPPLTVILCDRKDRRERATAKKRLETL